jgi:DNA modification methylase
MTPKDQDTQRLSILQGDCREVLKTLPDESVHCCVTSPPYWGLRSYLPNGHECKSLELGSESTLEDYITNMVDVFREVHRVLRRDGTLWLNLGDVYATDTKWGGSSSNKNEAAIGDAKRTLKRNSGLKPKDLVLLPARAALALQADGWWLRSDIIWAKPNPMPESVRDRPTKAHEYLFLLTKAERYFYDAEAIKEPCEPEAWHNPDFRRTRNFEIHPTTGNGDRNPRSISRNKRSVWTIATEPYRDAHFATFPTALVKPCILAGTKPGDVVLDPFGGSGTVGHVALELGRRAILIELNPAYCDMARQRCAVTHGLQLA